MMSRKGYFAEKLVKKELVKQYGPLGVIKIAIGGAADFAVIEKGVVKKVVEVKSFHGEEYHPKESSLRQFERICTFCQLHGCEFDLLLVKLQHGKKTKFYKQDGYAFCKEWCR